MEMKTGCGWFNWHFVLIFFPAAVATCAHQVINEMYGDNASVELDELPLHGGQHHMVDFAKKYFREAQRGRRSDAQCTADEGDSCANALPLLEAPLSVTKGPACTSLYCSDPKAKKGKEGRDPVDMVRFSKVKNTDKEKLFIFCISTQCSWLFIHVPTDD